MTRSTRLTAMLGLLVAVGSSGCATAASPWAQHAERADAKAALMDAGAICPVVILNETRATLDASYEVVGMRFDIGLLPAGQRAEFKVQCQAGRVRATAVSHTQALDEPQHRFQKMARLDLSKVTRLQLTQADIVY